jgi:hypothetical protein
MTGPIGSPPSKAAFRVAGLVLVLASGGCGPSSATKTTATSTAASKPAPASAAHHAAAAAKPAPGGRPRPTEPTSTASADRPVAAAKAAPPAPAKTTAPAPAPVPIPAARTKLGPPRTWSGSGDTTLGTIALPRSAVVRWTVSGHRFSVADATGKLAISGTGPTGASFAASGTYAGVKVSATGRWTLSMATLGA